MIRRPPISIRHCQKCNLGERFEGDETHINETYLDIDAQPQVGASARRVDDVEERSCKDWPDLNRAFAKSMKKETDTACPCNQIDIKQTCRRRYSQDATLTHLRSHELISANVWTHICLNGSSACSATATNARIIGSESGIRVDPVFPRLSRFSDMTSTTARMSLMACSLSTACLLSRANDLEEVHIQFRAGSR